MSPSRDASAAGPPPCQRPPQPSPPESARLKARTGYPPLRTGGPTLRRNNVIRTSPPPVLRPFFAVQEALALAIWCGTAPMLVSGLHIATEAILERPEHEIMETDDSDHRHLQEHRQRLQG